MKWGSDPGPEQGDDVALSHRGTFGKENPFELSSDSLWADPAGPRP